MNIQHTNLNNPPDVMDELVGAMHQEHAEALNASLAAKLKITPLIYVPIEPLVERYSGEWYTEFPHAFRNKRFDVTVIDGVALQDEVKTGTFLDINSTIHYKCSQMQTIAKMFNDGQVQHGTVFFFADIEFWGIESIRLMADMNRIKIYLTGFLHAASYTREDAFAIAAPYQKFTEVGWIAAFDRVFVGSKYHKAQVENERIRPLVNSNWVERDKLEAKIVATCNPIFHLKYPRIDVKRQKKIVLTNRFDIEKRPDETLILFSALKAQYPEWEFVVTTSRSTFRGNDPSIIMYARQLEAEGVITIKAGLTKLEYYTELASAAVMVTHSIEENYGYCIAEAIHYGCLPLMRKGLSHDEFSDDPRLFFTSTVAERGSPPGVSDFQRLEKLMGYFGTSDFPEIPKLNLNGMENIINEIKALL